MMEFRNKKKLFRDVKERARQTGRINLMWLHWEVTWIASIKCAANVYVYTYVYEPSYVPDRCLNTKQLQRIWFRRHKVLILELTCVI